MQGGQSPPQSISVSVPPITLFEHDVAVGIRVGLAVGAVVGEAVGENVGTRVGEVVGARVGLLVGAIVGEGVEIAGFAFTRICPTSDTPTPSRCNAETKPVEKELAVAAWKTSADSASESDDTVTTTTPSPINLADTRESSVV